MTRLPKWFVQWLRFWASGARRSALLASDRAAVFAAQYPELSDAISTAEDARARRDTRRQHAAESQARRLRNHALAAEQALKQGCRQ